jgi:polyhydroxyalkanoate synthesis regulator phasin
MTGVEVARHDRDVAAADLAGLRREVAQLEQDLQRREDLLVRDPSVLHQNERDRAARATELAKLKTAAQARAVEDAEKAARQAELASMRERLNELRGGVATFEQRMTDALAAIDAAIGEHFRDRKLSRGLDTSIRAMEAVLAGDEVHPTPGYAIGSRKVREFERRFEKLVVEMKRAAMP